MNELTFGIPPLRLRKEEKYTFPVLTMEAAPETKGGGYRFNFNKAGAELLLLKPEDHVAFSFTDSNIIVANLGAEENPNTYRVTKGMTFSNSRLHNYLNKLLETEGTEVEFVMTKFDSEDYTAVTITLLDDKTNEAEAEAAESVEAIEAAENALPVNNNFQEVEEF